MYLCNCRPVGQGLTPSALVDAVRDGDSRLRDVVARTDAGNSCKTCRPRLAKLNSTIQELAAERDKSGMGWPSADQRARAEDTINAKARG